MKRIRGFRLGRRLAMAWRWAFRQRRSRCRQPKRYLRLDCADVAARREAPASVAAKLFGWTRHLARRLKGAGGGGSGRYRRLGEERRLGSPLLEDLGGGDAWKKPPPKGFLAVYVGGKKKDEEEAGGGGGTPRRYLVPVIYFNHPLFGELLREAEEEFGFHHPGGITIPCPAAKFERVRTRIDAAADSLRWKSTKSFAGFSL